MEKRLLSNDLIKICVPVIAVKSVDILQQMEDITNHNVSFVEWRIDYFEHCECIDEVLLLAKKIRALLKDIGFIATFRTKEEGGVKSISKDDYLALLMAIKQSGLPDYVDVEGYSKPDVYHAISKQHSNTKCIVSYHNFQCIPNDREVLRILKSLQQLHADVVKIACMPNTMEDVVRYKNMIEEFKRQYDGLLIAIAMGTQGMESRVKPKLYHSCLTFASWTMTSAPGQLSYQQLREQNLELR